MISMSIARVVSGAALCLMLCLGSAAWADAATLDKGLVCPPGRAPNEAGNACEDCAPGSYSADGLVCINCPEGTFSSNAGSIQCIACDVGKAPNATQTACDTCEPGTYSPDGTACLDCPEGTFSDVFGSAACQTCPPGTTPSPDRTQCIPCEAGTFTPDSITCLDCPEGTFTQVTGSIQCQNCPEGLVSTADRTACDACAPGTFSTDGITCFDCPEGAFSNQFGSTACDSCPPGTTPSTDRTQCVPCEAGTYTTDSITCLDCPEGTFTQVTGSVACQDCPEGLVPTADRTACELPFAGYLRFIGTTNDWHEPTNWSGGEVPIASSDVLLDGADNVILDSSSGPITINNLYMQDDALLTLVDGVVFDANDIQAHGQASFEVIASEMDANTVAINVTPTPGKGSQKGPFGGFSLNPSAFAVDTTLSFSPASVLVMGIGGTSPAAPGAVGEGFHATITADTITLDGSLQLQLLYDFAPQAGDTFTIINATTTLSGQFVDLPEGALVTGFNDVGLYISYGPKTVTLTAAGIAEGEGECEVAECPAGSAPDYGLCDCVQCPPGTYSPDGTECLPCPSGSVSGEPGATACILCNCCLQANEAQTACDTFGEGECEGCIAQCAPGTYYSDATFDCADCPPGTVQPLENAVSCVPCAEGTVPNETRTECEAPNAGPSRFIGSDTNWFEPTNWSTGSVPDENTDVLLLTQTTIDPALSPAAVAVGDIFIENGGSLLLLPGAQLNFGQMNFDVGQLNAQSARMQGEGLTLTDGTEPEVVPGWGYSSSTVKLNPSWLDVSVLDLSSEGARVTFVLAGTTPAGPGNTGAGFHATVEAEQVTLGATLELELLNDFVPQDGDTFTIISVSGVTSVSGQFVDLPEGALVDSFRYYNPPREAFLYISYVGGDGNDVALRATVESPEGECDWFPCPAGSVQDFIFCDCVPCPAGTFSPDGNECKPCPQFTYAPDEGSAICTFCSETTNEEGTECFVGEGQCDGCHVCLEGTYFNLLTGECLDCPPGTIAPSFDLTACIACAAGTAPSAERDRCLDCEAGQYSADGRECLPCAANTFSNTVAAASCTDCPPGTESAPGSFECIPILEGEGEEGEGSSPDGADAIAARLLEEFTTWDLDENGLLSREEILARIRTLLGGKGVEGEDAEANALFDELDKNTDDQLSVGELRQTAGALSPVHAADQNGDGEVNLSELLRLIQFYNAEAYGCAENPGATEDGYDTGTGSEACLPHTSDYLPEDFIITLSELLRAIQFYNSGGLTFCPEETSEDNFCPANI